MDWNDRLKRFLAAMDGLYDERESLLCVDSSGRGYHTRVNGMAHPIRQSMAYASLLFYAGERLERAEKIALRIADLQDSDPNSGTYGLWSYFLEEPLSAMDAPDYNWADFIGSQLIYIINCHSKNLMPETVGRLKAALGRALVCDRKRNVSYDYTNICLMGSFLQIAGGEVLGDREAFSCGRERLSGLLEYTRVCGSYSEYNSSAYAVIALEEISRMLLLFEDAQCRAMAQELNRYGWLALADHYSLSLGELCPPQKRCYTDFDIRKESYGDMRDINAGTVHSFIYLATDGVVASLAPDDAVSMEWLILKPQCPPEVAKRFLPPEGERFFCQTYYKKNDLRNPNSDRVIIQELDSPDLAAYSYLTPGYIMGAFRETDLWNQRRTGMLYWKNILGKACLRLRALHDGRDFCGALAFTAMHKNVMLTNLGLVFDHGDFHYILDPLADGMLRARQLSCRLETAGDIDEVRIEQNGSSFEITDGAFHVGITIKNPLFDGAPCLVRVDGEKKYIEIVFYEGEEREFDLKPLGACTVTILFVADCKGSIPAISVDSHGGLRTASACDLTISSHEAVVDYKTAIKDSKATNHKFKE